MLAEDESPSEPALITGASAKAVVRGSLEGYDCEWMHLSHNKVECPAEMGVNSAPIAEDVLFHKGRCCFGESSEVSDDCTWHLRQDEIACPASSVLSGWETNKSLIMDLGLEHVVRYKCCKLEPVD